MITKSHLRPGNARIVLALAALVYAFAASAAPVLHIMEDAEKVSGIAAAVAVPGETGERPAPVPPPGPMGDLDCFFCQVLSFAAHPFLGETPLNAWTTDIPAVALNDGPRSSISGQPANARGPPLF